MAYEKQTWQTGDVVTSAKLNHMEDGIAGASSGGGGVFVVNVTTTYDEQEHAIYTCDKTAGEVWTALGNGSVVFSGDIAGGLFYGNFLGAYYYPDDPELEYEFNVEGIGVLYAASASDYPTTAVER